MWETIFDFTLKHGFIQGLVLPMVIIACIITYIFRSRLKRTSMGRLSGRQQILFGILIFGLSYLEIKEDDPEVLESLKKIFTEERKEKPKSQVYFPLTEHKGIITNCRTIEKTKAEVIINEKPFILPHRFCGNLRPIMNSMIIYYSDKNNIVWQIDRFDKTPFMTLRESGYDT
jgi:hypothetical protein